MGQGNFCHGGETELKKNKAFNLGVKARAEMSEDKGQTKASDTVLAKISEVEKDKGVYVGVEDDAENEEGGVEHASGYDGLGNIWNEMAFALECSKVCLISL